MAADTEQCKQESAEIRNHKIILDQKQLRINQNLQHQKKEMGDVELSVKRLRFEMDRWNTALTKNDEKVRELENSNTMVEKEFVAKLKDIEVACVKMEANVQSVRREKQQISEDIVEAERQILLWERKIHLEKEIHDALDPSVGQTETQCMLKEIHRMELRRDQLKRRQEQMIQEMERCIFKRDSIALRHEPRKRTTGASVANLQRQLESTKKNLNMCRTASEETDEHITEIELEMEQVQVAVSEALGDTQRLDEMNFEMQQQILVKSITLQAKEYHAEKLTKMSRKYEMAVGGLGELPQGFQVDLENERLVENNQMDLIRVLGEACPQDVFSEQLWRGFYQES